MEKFKLKSVFKLNRIKKRKENAEKHYSRFDIKRCVRACVCVVIPARLIKLDAGPSLEMEMRTADISYLLIYKDQGSADLYILYQLHSPGGTRKKVEEGSGSEPTPAPCPDLRKYNNSKINSILVALFNNLTQ